MARDQSLAHHLVRLAAEEGLPAAQAELGFRLSLGLRPSGDVRGMLKGVSQSVADTRVAAAAHWASVQAWSWQALRCRRRW